MKRTKQISGPRVVAPMRVVGPAELPRARGGSTMIEYGLLVQTPPAQTDGTVCWE